MQRPLLPAIVGGVLALGMSVSANAAPIGSQDVGATRGSAQMIDYRVCRDSDGDRVPCRRAYRYYYSDPDDDVGVTLRFGDRRYRYRDRYWD